MTVQIASRLFSLSFLPKLRLIARDEMWLDSGYTCNEPRGPGEIADSVSFNSGRHSRNLALSHLAPFLTHAFRRAKIPAANRCAIESPRPALRNNKNLRALFTSAKY